MKKYSIILLLAFAAIFCMSIAQSYAGVQIPWSQPIQEVSQTISTTGDINTDVKNLWFSILAIVKRVAMAMLVVMIVWTGGSMIISMGSDEEQLSGAKRNLWYSIIALLFINIPGTLYQAFFKDSTTSIGGAVWKAEFEEAEKCWNNVLFNAEIFCDTFNQQIVWFLEIFIFVCAFAMITIAGIQIMTSQGREERIKEAKNKILYSVLGLIFVWIIEAWKHLAFGWKITDGVNLASTLSQLALFFAVPVALIFLTLAGYYYITSNGDEERIKRAKSILINTVLATLILLWGYTVLLDLWTI